MSRFHYTPDSMHVARLLALVLLFSLAGQQLVRADLWMEKAEVELERNLEADAEAEEEGKWKDPLVTLADAHLNALSHLHGMTKAALDPLSAHPDHPCEEVNTPPPELRS